MNEAERSTAGANDRDELRNDAPACERCGRFDGVSFAGTTLCAACIHTCGSCCPELGADDLWSNGSARKTAT